MGQTQELVHPFNPYILENLDMSVPCLTGQDSRTEEFLAQYDTFLLDCDGVICSGDEAIPGARETIEYLERAGKRVIFVTNNSTQPRAKQSLRFQGLGIPAHADQIFTSAYSTAIYLSQILRMSAPRNKVFVLGEEGVEAELASVGLVSIGGTDERYQKDLDVADLRDIASGAAMDDNVGAVVVGMDSKFNYLKLCYAMHYISRGAYFLATNTDPTFPAFGTVFPAAGCISAMLVAMLGVEPLVLGKPSEAMMRAVQSRYELDLKRTCMVGDRLDTDIQFGIECGLGGTLLVLTGVTQREDLERILDPKLRPGAYVESFSDLLAWTQKV